MDIFGFNNMAKGSFLRIMPVLLVCFKVLLLSARKRIFKSRG